MAQTGFWNRTDAQSVSQAFGTLRQEIQTWVTLKDDIQTLEALIEEATANDEPTLHECEAQLAQLEQQFSALEIQTLFTGKYDGNHAIMSIHAGAGGADAQDWAEILLRMFLRFAERMGWKAAVLSETRGTEAGIKSVTIRVQGARAYGYLKAEAGVHRLVRQSPFNADALRQTSFALVDVIPELEDDADIKINPDELRIDTFMSGGHGGQSVNTTYSAVRIVHIPTGITVQCQNERSQAQNKETALKVLRGKLLQRKLEEQQQELQALRGQVVSADWGNQIRSYVLHPYKMVKDHRTGYETSAPDDVLNGNLMPFIEAFLRQR
ncbi:peptide chain release factor 2 [Candidatus Uhrbacteria bacterium]|nr:peptide chain release factor 2 [Candidatus Uhrbacteria bacterium]